MVYPFLAVFTLLIGDATGSFCLGHVLEQKGMIAFFDTQNIAHVMLM